MISSSKELSRRSRFFFKLKSENPMLGYVGSQFLLLQWLQSHFVLFESPISQRWPSQGDSPQQLSNEAIESVRLWMTLDG